MTQQSGTSERFLQKDVVLSEIMRVMEPDLAFLDLVPSIDSEGQPVVYGIKNSKSADARKQQARTITPSSVFPEIQITRMTKGTALLNKEGLSIRLDEDALRLPAGKDMLMDSYQSIGAWMAETINTAIYTVLRAGGTDAGITPAAIWSAATATPVEDLRNFKNAMKREGYPYRMTNAFVHMNNLNELEGFLMSSEIAALRDLVFKSNPMDTISLPLSGNLTVKGLFSGVTDGDILGVDKANPGAAVYYYNDPKYSAQKVSYETIIDGKPVVKQVPNFGLSTHQFFDDDSHETVVQIWCDYKPVVKDAYSILYDNGL